MGMFDTICVAVKCPNCGDDGEKELQTKDLECIMDCFQVGDSIGTTQFRYVGCFAGCKSAACHEWQIKRDGYKSGFGYGWRCWAEIDARGLITGKIVDELPLPVERRK